jgi:dTDP-4-dehydrorhamnose 3,5-epimerase
MKSTEAQVRGNEFAMSYVSLTFPGQMRDRDRWHTHHHQKDRFVVLLGEMVLALYDPRPESPTRGKLETVLMKGAYGDTPALQGKKGEVETFMVVVPEEVYHCIGNLSNEPFLLQNYPTRLYDPSDEGRVPFASLPVDCLDKSPFGWEKVEVRH